MVVVIFGGCRGLGLGFGKRVNDRDGFIGRHSALAGGREGAGGR